MRDRLQVFLVAILSIGVLSITPPAAAVVPEVPRAQPEAVGMDGPRLAHIDEVVKESLRRKRMPGCVVVVGRNGKQVFRKAYGYRQLKPAKEPMTVDTVFDLASLTKPIATAACVMRLVEAGKLHLDDPVAEYIPAFGENGKHRITVRQLLTHQGGLIPDNALRDYQDGRDEALKRIYALKPHVEPGTKFIYTDVGYIVLAELIHTITGNNIHEYSNQAIYQPLGMNETGFLPPTPLRERSATTQQREGRWMRGEVHDPRAYLLGGIAGHAGLFSTADDLSRFARMLLGGGELGGARVLKTETVELMSRPERVSSGLRGLGWDIRTGYSSNRGDLFTPRAFGHGGFTGTTFWVDPGLDLFVVFLSNRVHPDGDGLVNPLAGRIGTIAAAAIQDTGTAHRRVAHVSRGALTGIDVLQRDGFRQLKGRNVGLITNQTGINRDRVSTVKLLNDAEDVNLVALFSPEHGFAGKLEAAEIADSADAETGLDIYSLYGKTRSPTPESLQGIDTLVFDIQDIGTRFYTFISTMGNTMRSAAKHDISFVVLDRPNPIGGLEVQGPLLDAGSESFVGFHRIPVRHGMTTGELARLFNAELELGLELTVIPVEGWRRGDLFDATGLPWSNPSPNLRSLTQALLYPGIGLLETTNLSVGRGTDTPFEAVGAPWIDGVSLAAELNAAGLSGVRFVPIRFTPDASKFENQTCDGVNIIITHRDTFHPLQTGLTLARTLRRIYPEAWQTSSLNRLLCNANTRNAILAGASVSEMRAAYLGELEEFNNRRAAFLLY